MILQIFGTQLYPHDPGSPSENGFMEPQNYADEVIGHPKVLRI